MRTTRALPAAALGALLAATGCSGDDRPEADGCVGRADEGTVRVLQGQPRDLDGGASIGIGAVHLDADPPDVTFVLGGADPGESGTEVPVGGTVEVRGSGYEVTQICPGVVTLRPAAP